MMKKMSYWAIMNPIKSQMLLICAHLMLAYVAIYSGVCLFAHDIFIPQSILYIGESLFLALLICYPIRRARYKFWKTNYLRQKLMDAAFVVSYLLMATTMANMDANAAYNEDNNTPFATQIVLKMKENSKPLVANDSKLAILSKTELRKQFKNFVIQMKEQEPTDAQQRNLTQLKISGIILLMIVGMVLVFALACSVSCSGSGSLFIALLLGGWLLVLVIGASAIRALTGKRPSNYQPMPEEG